MPVSVLEGRLISPYCCRVLLTSDVPQEDGLAFTNPLVIMYLLSVYDWDSFLHGNEGDAAGEDVSAAPNCMDPEIET